MVEIELNDLISLIYCARRYSDGRKTYTPYEFNKIYGTLVDSYGEINKFAVGGKALPGDHLDATLKESGKYWPWAIDGFYNPTTGDFSYSLPKIKDEE